MFIARRLCILASEDIGLADPQAMVQALLNIAVFGMDPQSAVEAPRCGTYSYPGSSEPHAYHAGRLNLDGRYPRKVGLHQSCHGLRELGLGRSSEQMVPPFDKVGRLLQQLEGIELVSLTRPDECCGFGGTFALAEEAISCLMGRDRIADHLKAGAEIVTGTDVSCLMHMDGLARRARQPLAFRHVAEVLAEAIS